MSLNASHAHSSLFSDSLCPCTSEYRGQVIKMPDPETEVLLVSGEGIALAVEFTCLLNEKQKELIN